MSKFSQRPGSMPAAPALRLKASNSQTKHMQGRRPVVELYRLARERNRRIFSRLRRRAAVDVSGWPAWTSAPIEDLGYTLLGADGSPIGGGR